MIFFFSSFLFDLFILCLLPFQNILISISYIYLKGSISWLKDPIKGLVSRSSRMGIAKIDEYKQNPTPFPFFLFPFFRVTLLYSFSPTRPSRGCGSYVRGTKFIMRNPLNESYCFWISSSKIKRNKYSQNWIISMNP